MKELVIVDMQKDFINGSLGTKEAVAIVPNVVKKGKEFDGEVVFTLDTHPDNYLETQEGKHLPVEHCIKGTDGWKLNPELEELRKERDAKVFEKTCFGSVKLTEYLTDKYNKGELDSVELVGLCTDICVVSNALLIKAAMPELPVYVDASCCAGVTPAKHQAALDVMESCQVNVTNK